MHSSFKTLLSLVATVPGITNIFDQSALQAQGTGGCGRTHAAIGETEPHTIQSSGGIRTFTVHLPSQYNKTQPTGMILSFHGHGVRQGTSKYQEALSRFSDPIINPNMIAVYPQGLHHAWEGAPYAQCGVSDKTFTTDLINYMRDHFCIDNSQIYASGKSNGGGFVDTLACSPDHGGNFAAFAMASAALYTESTQSCCTPAGSDEPTCTPVGPTCTPARSPLPILEFHGTEDSTIPYNGGSGSDGVGLPAIPTWLAGWAVRDECPNPPQAITTDQNNSQVHWTTYTCDSGTPRIVQGYKTDGQKHWWPSKHCNEDNDVHNVCHVAPIEGSEIMMAFFNANSKP